MVIATTEKERENEAFPLSFLLCVQILSIEKESCQKTCGTFFKSDFCVCEVLSIAGSTILLYYSHDFIFHLENFPNFTIVHMYLYYDVNDTKENHLQNYAQLQYSHYVFIIL